MGTHRRPSVSWLVVVSLCVSGLLAVPAVSWTQETIRSCRPPQLRLEVGDRVWVTDAPQLDVEKKIAAGVNRSWDGLVGSIETGKKVTITLMNAGKVEGRLLAIDAGSITVERPDGPQFIAAADVFRVRYAGIRRRHVVYGALIGMATGAATFWAIDRLSSQPNPYESGADIGAIVFGLPGGALVGAALPIGPPLYEAPQVVGQTR